MVVSHFLSQLLCNTVSAGYQLLKLHYDSLLLAPLELLASAASVGRPQNLTPVHLTQATKGILGRTEGERAGTEAGGMGGWQSHSLLA